MESKEYIDGHSFDGFEKPEIDNLPIITATEIFAQYCLEAPDSENNSYASRMVVDGLFAAVAIARDDRQSGSDFNEWIYRLRLSTDDFPQQAYSGLEIRLPYGVGVCSNQGVQPSDEVTGTNAGVFVSFKNSLDRWSSIELRNSYIKRSSIYSSQDSYIGYRSFVLHEDTVMQVDDKLRIATKQLNQEDIGFDFSIALSFLEKKYLKVTQENTARVGRFSLRDGITFDT